MRDNRIVVGQLTYYSGLDNLRGLADDDKINWLAGRLEKVVFRPLREVRALGPSNQAIWDLNLGVVTILCSAVEALGSFYAPQLRDRDAFLKYVNDFMDPMYKNPSSGGHQTYADILYGKFRCGLAHGFSIEGHEVATRPGTYLVDQQGYISIDLWTLFDDVERSAANYLAQVRANAVTKADFISRFDQVFVHPY